MENKTNTLPIGQLLIYAIIIGVTLISVPKTGMSYIAMRMMQLVEVLAFIILFIPRVQKVITFSRFSLYVNLWWFGYLLITYMHPHKLGLTPIFWWLHIGVFLLIGCHYWQNNYETHLRWMTILFTGLIYLNAILLILFPDGLWIDEDWIGRGSPVRYLFGNYNQIGFVCLLAITTHSIYTFYTNKGFLNLYVLLAVSIFSVIIVGSMTSTTGIVLLATYILFRRRIKHPMLLVGIFSIVYIAVFMSIIWLGRSVEEFTLATNFIENILQKDTTFSERTIIWENAVSKIAQNPYIGYGIQDVDWNDEHLGGSGPHNLWLMLLLQGGIVLCMSFIGIVIYAFKSALRVRTSYSTAAIVGLCALFLMSFFETYDICIIFLLLQITFYTSSLDGNTTEKESQPTTS